MRRFLFVHFLFLSFSFSLTSQSLCDQDGFRVLHFTKTTGFDHNTRAQSSAMFSDIGSSRGFTITDTQDTDLFDELDSLLKFPVIIFSNTSSNNNNPALSSSQQANFKAYIDAGGSFIGIHAASDAYRNNNWKFYTDTILGAVVQNGPNHTPANHVNIMDHMTSHETLSSIPDPWNKEEEYYYWDINQGMIDSINFTGLLRVRRTGPDSYDRSRRMAWYRELPSGARTFYTALGHKRINYTTTGNSFRKLLENAVCWTANGQPGSFNGGNVKVAGGHLSIVDNGAGIILKSPLGKCFLLTVDENGQLTSTPTSCVE